MKARKTQRRLLLGGLCLLAPAFMVGCFGGGPSEGGSKTADSCAPNEDGPVVAMIVDTSGSTKDERANGGEFEEDLIAAVEESAVSKATIFVSSADGDPLSRGTWELSECGFQLSGIAGQILQEQAIKNVVDEEFVPKLKEVVQTETARGSDLVGALLTAERLFSNYGDRPRSLVLLTDGGITEGVNNWPPISRNQRRAAINRLRQQGLLPDLTGGKGSPVSVWIGGLGQDVEQGSLSKTNAVIEFWKELIPAANGDLVAQDSRLPSSGIPAE